MEQRPLRILIVEDEALIASGFACCLEEIGYQAPEIASTGQEAIEFIERNQPDLILMDINLPGMNGIATMRRVNETHDIPCIFITGYPDQQQIIAQAEAKNVYGYLIKPVDANDLKAVIGVTMARFRDYHHIHESLSLAQKTLEERKLVERAKGILMDAFEMKEQQAMQYLQKKSRATNKRLAVVAQEIILMEKRINE